MLKALGEAATKIRVKLGESLASVQKYDAPAENVTTSSLEALQAFSLGYKAANVLDFKATLGRNGVRVPDMYWSQDQDRLKLRLKVELTNLVYGLAQGDELETKGDPQVQQAAGLFPRVARILQGK